MCVAMCRISRQVFFHVQIETCFPVIISRFSIEADLIEVEC